MFPSKNQQAQAHGNKQHVEDPCHIVNVQLTAHDFFLFITADASEPDGLQLLCVTCERGAQNTGLSSICITLAVFLGSNRTPSNLLWTSFTWDNEILSDNQYPR